MTLYVGGLDYECSERDLFEHFEKAGRVKDVKVITDRETNRSRGFAFVNFENDDDADTAVDKIHNSELRGRQITVEFSKPQDRMARGRGRGRGGMESRGGYRGDDRRDDRRRDMPPQRREYYRDDPRDDGPPPRSRDRFAGGRRERSFDRFDDERSFRPRGRGRGRGGRGRSPPSYGGPMGGRGGRRSPPIYSRDRYDEGPPPRRERYDDRFNDGSRFNDGGFRDRRGGYDMDRSFEQRGGGRDYDNRDRFDGRRDSFRGPPRGGGRDYHRGGRGGRGRR